jgi:hypothetical protein
VRTHVDVVYSAAQQQARGDAGRARLRILWLSTSTSEEAAACAAKYELGTKLAGVALGDLPAEYDAIVVSAL